jgi:hypothetical protein
MPCYQVRTVSVEFKSKNKKLLEEAAKKLGWIYSETEDGKAVIGSRFVIDFKTRKATFEDYRQGDFNQLKRAYSEAAIEAIAKKKRWAIKKKAEGKIEMRRY